MLPGVPLSVWLSWERRWLTLAAPEARSCPSPRHPPWDGSLSRSVGRGERPFTRKLGQAARLGCGRKRNCSAMRKDAGRQGLSGDGSTVVV